MKKTMVFLVSLILILVNCLPCLAEAQTTPPANQISSNPNSARYVWRNDVAPCSEDEVAFTYLECGIDRSGSSAVYVYALTETNIVADYTIKLSIQRWENNSWTGYTGYDFYGYDKTTWRTGTTVSVEPGYYYRLVVTHIAVTLYDNCSSRTYTTSLYVN